MKNVMAILGIPADYHVVQTTSRTRNGEPVTVERLQTSAEITPNNAHMTLVRNEAGTVISFNDSTFKAGGKLPAAERARHQASQLFQQLDSTYAANLTYMRTERQERHYFDHGERISTPVYWIKFAHRNGSYNWVTIGPDNRVIEVERESYWDYFRNRRATEMWNYDDWVLAYEGKGPQMAAPNALV